MKRRNKIKREMEMMEGEPLERIQIRMWGDPYSNLLMSFSLS